MTYKVLRDGEVIKTGNLASCVLCVRMQVGFEAQELYENYELDNYTMEDIMTGLEEYIMEHKSFCHSELRHEWKICPMEDNLI